MRRIVVILAPWPNVHLLSKVLDHLLNRVMLVAAAGPRSDPTASVARAAAILLRGGHSIRTVPTQTLDEARVVEAIAVMTVPVHTRRGIVHGVCDVRFEDGTAISVGQQCRQFVLFTRARVREILVVCFVLVNVVQVMWKELVRRRRCVVIVQRPTADLQKIKSVS